jgi:protein tyrosine phosphatase
VEAFYPSQKSSPSDYCNAIMTSKSSTTSTATSLSLSQSRKRPNDCTYWVSSKYNLLAGEYPTVSYGTTEQSRIKLGQYLDCGIRTFIDLTDENEKQPYANLLKEEAVKRNIDNTNYYRISIPDFGIPSSKQTMIDVLDTIDKHLLVGKNSDNNDDDASGGVYVHCRGGIGRTGTAVGCWLVRNNNISGEEALEETNRLFQTSDRSSESSHSPETSEQMNFVRNWKE